jgi:hypothetical protein
VQRIAATLFAAAAIIVSFSPSSLAAQDAPAAAPPAYHKIQAFIGIAYEDTPVSVNEQVIYCPILGQCAVPGTIFTNHEGLKGLELAASHHFSPGFALVADATGTFGKATTGFPTEAKAHQYTFLGGPEFSRPHKHVSPYVHALFGAAHQSVTPSGNSFFITFPNSAWGFAAAGGVGLDIKISPRASFRLLQADYLVTRLNNRTQYQPRISAGILLRF